MNIFLEAALWFFAIAGFFCLMTDLTEFFCSFIKRHNINNECVILTVKDCQDNIEALLRSIIWQYSHKNGTAISVDIVVVDLGSTDDTPKILDRLSRKHNFIHITDKNGCIEFIKNMA